MSYSKIFRTIALFVSSPAKAWEELSLQKDRSLVLSEFLYPMIGLCSLAIFVGALFTYGWDGPESFGRAMSLCCTEAVALFAGYFLASYLIYTLGNRFFSPAQPRADVYFMTAYGMVVPLVLWAVVALLPALRIVSWVLNFYTFYIVWEALPNLFRFGEENRLRYTVFASLLLIAVPGGMSKLMAKLVLMVG